MNRLTVFLMFMLCLGVMVSCDKTKDEVVVPDYGDITIGNYPTVSANFCVLSYEKSLGNSLYEMNLEVFAGINLIQWSQSYEVTTPIATVQMNVVSTSFNSLPVGTYVFDSTEVANTFNSAKAIYAPNGTISLNDYSYDSLMVTSGTLVVYLENDKYELNFVGIDASNDTVKITYNGDLQYYGSSDY